LCTFQPNADKQKKLNNSVTNNTIDETINKLYKDSANKASKLKTYEEKKENELKALENNSYHPKVNRFNSHVFEVNPLIHDEVVKKEVQRLEQARIEKKLDELQKKKGITNIKLFKNIDSIIKEEDLTAMQFSIEKKTYKDTFDHKDIYTRKSKSITPSRDTFNQTMRFKGKSSGVQPLLYIDVNIDESNHQEKLEIYPNDDPMIVSENFCLKYGLSEDKKAKLQKIIVDKLSENIISNR